MRSTTLWLASASAAALLAVPAFAQAVPPAGTPTASDANSVDAKSADDGDSGDDIIVTASKRETTLQDTPIAVSVTSAETIRQAQVRDLLDIQTLVPSLRIDQLQSSANTNFVIRGFGNGANNAGIEPSVGVFIDGVYRSRSAAQIGDLPNLRRVEVLRGPQSTLFGKNASSGIISVVTAEPSFTFGGGVEGSYGNYNAFLIKADVTGPLTDTLAFSLAGNYNKRDGYAQDLRQNIDVNDRNRYGVRGQLLWQPTDAFKLRLIGDYDKIDENCCIAANVRNGSTGAIVNQLAGGVGLDANRPFSYNIYNNFLSSNNIQNYGASAQADYETGAFTVTSITAYRQVRAKTNQDSDFTGADLLGRNSQDLDIDTFTQELRVASDFDGPVNFLLGGFLFDEKIDQKNQILYGTQFRPFGDALVRGASGGALNVALLENTFGALEGAPTRYQGRFFGTGQGLTEAYKLSDRAISVFGTVDFDVNERLRLTAGFNYTRDRKNFSTNVASTDVFSGVNLDAPQYAPFRNQLLFQGGLAQQVGNILRLGRSASAAEIGAFAQGNPAAFGQVSAGVQAFATANQNNPAANPLNGLKPLQFLPGFLNLPNSVEPNRTRDSDFTYSLRASYELTDSVNVYATYATGFKASSVNLSRDSRPLASNLAAIRAANLAPVNLSGGTRFAGPESSEVYEVGLKAQFDQVAFNLAVFKQTVDGFQSNIFTGTGFALANAGKQQVRGFEFDGSVSPVDALTLTMAVTYLDPKYVSFVNTGIAIPGQPTPQQGGPQLDLSGAQPSGIPELSMSLGAAYTQELGSSGTSLTLRTDYSYESPVQIVDNVPGVKRNQQSLSGALILGFERGIELSVWGRNILNNRYLISVFPSVAQSGSLSGYPNVPRTYGISARVRF